MIIRSQAYLFVMLGFFLLLTADVATIVAGSKFVSPEATFLLEKFVNPLCRIIGTVLGFWGMCIQVFATRRR